MKKMIISTCFVLNLYSAVSQTFTDLDFKYAGDCELKIQNTNADKYGNKGFVYQCFTKSSSLVLLYRLNVVAFVEKSRDNEKFLARVKSDSELLGTTISTTFEDQPAIQLSEDVIVEGYKIKQVTITTLYKNKSFTFVLGTTASNYNKLLAAFKKDFSFL